MRIFRTLLLSACAAGLLAGCGGGGSTGSTVNTSTARGTLIQNPPLRVASVNAADLTAQLQSSQSGQQLQAIAGTPFCGIDYHYIKYATVGGAGEATTATGVMMVPTGTAAPCTGPRPIVLYAHGTSTVKSFNLAAVGDPTNDAYSESALIGAMFAAQGYIVVAPNYAGYDTSTLPYHPYLNADQQSKDMIDALTAARSALGHIFASATTDSGKLFITGYSQGGHVAMATHKAMQALGMTVTASAPMSGPYAMAAFGDAVFFGDVNLGSTVFTPLLATSYQKAYGNIYASPSDIFAAPYAAGVATLLPSLTPLDTLFQQNSLPQTALFNSTAPTTNGASLALDALFPTITPPTTPAAEAALFALGFASTNFLVNNTYRLAYVADAAATPDGAVPTVTTGMPPASPTNTLRQAFKANDLRGWSPTAPVLLCGGHADPTVFYSVNTGTVATILASNPYVSTIDVDSSAGYTPYGGALSAPIAGLQAALQPQFATTSTAVFTAARGGVAGQNAVVQAYHGTLVPPFCTKAAQQFFSGF